MNEMEQLIMLDYNSLPNPRPSLPRFYSAWVLCHARVRLYCDQRGAELAFGGEGMS